MPSDQFAQLIYICVFIDIFIFCKFEGDMNSYVYINECAQTFLICHGVILFPKLIITCAFYYVLIYFNFIAIIRTMIKQN